MSTEQTLMQRSNSCCELCKAEQQLAVYRIPPNTGDTADNSILLCQHCLQQIDPSAELDPDHWRCLNDSMWSQFPAVQVMAWRQLNRLSEHHWAQDLLAMLYLEDDVLQWAKATQNELAGREPTLDSNGTALSAGDTVTLIKDLVVKGANFTAKRGTAVRNISLTSDTTQIEGKINGTRIVLLSRFLKKSG